MPATRLLWFLALAITLSACSGDPLGRQAISGTVKVDGQPLAKGDISIQPLEGQATSGGGEIFNGKYSVPRELGLVPGKYRIEIHAPVPGTAGKADENTLPGDPLPPARELIPPDWNKSSTQTIDVRKQGPFEFNFEVSTKSNASKAKP